MLQGLTGVFGDTGSSVEVLIVECDVQYQQYVLGTTGRKPDVSKSNWLHVFIF